MAWSYWWLLDKGLYRPALLLSNQNDTLIVMENLPHPLLHIITILDYEPSVSVICLDITGRVHLGFLLTR